jgi:Protein of unknown function (DUF2934)
MARTKTDERTATAADRPPKSLAQRPSGTNTDVARRADGLYPARGREHGDDVEDWMQAARELRASTATA